MNEVNCSGEELTEDEIKEFKEISERTKKAESSRS